MQQQEPLLFCFRAATFEPVKIRKREYTKVNSLEELLGSSEAGAFREIIYPGEIDLKILETISTDARTPAKEIARRIGITTTMARNRLARLVKRYGIKYTIEMAPRPFGYFRYICLVKFLKRRPDLEEVKKVLEAEPAVLYAAALKGDYDLFIYMIAENTQILENKIYEIRSTPIFALHPASWVVTYITYAYGYVLLRDAFFEDLKAKVWHRTKETPRKPRGAITEREFQVLKLLNENSRLEFVEMDKRLGFERGASQYVYHKLIDRGIILRATITMQALPKKYDVLAV
ncbi:MAG: winged helix-turn-helix transcriptional regulator, partial [Candidatus Micrarchaeaceae archaeon]